MCETQQLSKATVCAAHASCVSQACCNAEARITRLPLLIYLYLCCFVYLTLFHPHKRAKEMYMFVHVYEDLL